SYSLQCNLSSSTDTTTTELLTLSLHDALPICHHDLPPHRELRRERLRHGVEPPVRPRVHRAGVQSTRIQPPRQPGPAVVHGAARDRKSTRLNSSHVKISYAVFCLKKKKQVTIE